MTLGAAHLNVSTGQRELCTAVIEGGWFPSHCVVTFLTGMRELISDMVWLAGTLKVCIVTGPAVHRRAIVLSVRMTLRAGRINVRAGQREIRQVVIKRGRLPCRRIMTLCAGMTELIGDVIGVVNILVITLVTGPAIRGSAGVLAVGMTFDATHAYVCSGQWEIGEIVVERCRLPGLHGVTGRAVMREVSSFVIRVDRRGKVIVMA